MIFESKFKILPKKNYTFKNFVYVYNFKTSINQFKHTIIQFILSRQKMKNKVQNKFIG